MKKIRYEEYVKCVDNRLDKYNNKLYWHKSSFMKLNLFHYRYTFILFKRYMDYDIFINWDIEYE